MILMMMMMMMMTMTMTTTQDRLDGGGKMANMLILETFYVPPANYSLSIV